MPIAAAFDFPGSEQHQAEHRLRSFVLRQDTLGDFADRRQAGAQFVLALRPMERFQKVTLLNADQVARLTLDEPHLHVGQKFQGRAVPILQAAGT